MSRLRVAAVQLAVGTDVDANLVTVLRMLDEAAEHRPDVVVLPEFANHISWYDSPEQAWAAAQDVDGKFASAVAAKAAEIGAWVLLNVTVRRDDRRITGTNLLFDPAGALVATGDKQVLMGAENDHLSPATDNAPIVDTPWGPVGAYSCMDGVIFETPRGLAVRGARLLLNSLNSFALDEASLHIPVRAAENKVWVVAANKVGPLVPAERLEQVSKMLGVPPAMLHGAGESQVVAPDGRVVAKGPRDGECVVVADIDLAEAINKRRPDGTDVMAARRPAVYAPIAAEPTGVRPAPGAAEVVAAVVQVDGEAALAQVRRLVAGGAQLVVLPELAAVAAELAPLLAGSDALVVTSVREGGAHVGVVVSADGVVHRQVQLHASARHASWQRDLGSAITSYDAPWGRLAVLVGDDAVFPESCRLAAIAGAEVVAVPTSVLEEWELSTGLLERAAENRVNVVAASRPGPAGASCVVALTDDFTLWTSWSAPFAGDISKPPITRVDPAAASATVVVRPASAANRLVSRRTDVVDSRPWRLASVLAVRGGGGLT